MKRLAVRAIAGLLFAAAPACRAKEPVVIPFDQREVVVRSRLAGTWYAGREKELRSELQGCLEAAVVPAATNAIGLIVPHAGYRFSGAVAAHGYAAVKGLPFARVVVLGPTHRVRMPGVCSLPEATHYETPLGRLAVDRDFVARLRKSPRFAGVPQAHEGEHSVEIQMPFLQAVLPSVPVVPVVVGQLDDAALADVASALKGLVDSNTLVVASSDFTHYGPNYGYIPFTDNVEKNLEKLDKGALALIEKKDAAGFLAYCNQTGATVCGRDNIAVLLAMLPPSAACRLLKYDTSGRIAGDFDNSVSYMSVLVEGAWPAPAAAAAVEGGAALAAEDKAALLELARETLRYYFEHRRPPSPAEAGISVSPAMRQAMGAFVTLKVGDSLRGCIGEIRAARPLFEAVIARSLDAAFRDERFLPLQRNELDKVKIEISALEPPRPVASYRDIVPGRHGILLAKAGRGAVFLPQVATEQGWGLEETLSHLAAKAGLSPDAWQEGASFEVFEATVFGEGHP